MIIFFFVKQLVVNMHVYVYVYIAKRPKKFKGTTPLICGRELGEEGGGGVWSSHTSFIDHVFVSKNIKV